MQKISIKGSKYSTSAIEVKFIGGSSAHQIFIGRGFRIIQIRMHILYYECSTVCSTVCSKLGCGKLKEGVFKSKA